MTSKNLRLDSLRPKLVVGNVAGGHSTKMFALLGRAGNAFEVLSQQGTQGDLAPLRSQPDGPMVNLIYGAL